jgi:hypothetical protein
MARVGLCGLSGLDQSGQCEGFMRVVYLVYSIAGWIAFMTLMGYWAGYVLVGRRAARRSPLNEVPPRTVTDDPPAPARPQS